MAVRKGVRHPATSNPGRDHTLRELHRGVIWKADQRQLFSSRDGFDGESRVKERGLPAPAYASVKESPVARLFASPAKEAVRKLAA